MAASNPAVVILLFTVRDIYICGEIDVFDGDTHKMIDKGNFIKGKLSAKIHNFILNKINTSLSETTIWFPKFGSSLKQFNLSY